MSKLRLTGETSGYVELAPQSVANNNTLKLPDSGDTLVSSDFSGNVNIAGIITATSFSGDITGTATTATTALAADTATTATTAGYATTAGISTVSQGLTGTPNITVGTVTANAISASGTVGSASSVLTSSGSGIYWSQPASGAWTYISSVTASNPSATIDFTSNIDSTYDTYVFVGKNLVPTTDAVHMRMRYYDGSTWTPGTSMYGSQNLSVYSTTPIASARNVGSYDELYTSNENAYSGTSNVFSRGGLNFIYYVSNPSDTTAYKHAYGEGFLYGSASWTNNTILLSWSHVYGYTTAVTGVRFFWSSSDIVAGKIDMYGIKNS